MYDVLRFTYIWNKNKISEKQGWYCEDGYVVDPDGRDPQIDVYNNSRQESFTADSAQDCVVDQDRSSVSINEEGYATFTVHFIRELKTRGNI